MIYLELSKNLKLVVNQAHQVAKHVFRPISRKYDRAEHEYPKELDLLAALMDGLNAGGGQKGAGIDTLQQGEGTDQGVRNGANMSTCLGMTELCWGDVGLAISIPRQGLGNAAITAVADADQKKRFKGLWAAMAITEPGAGSDSANIRTTARLDGDEWVLDGEKIYVTAGSRADAVVVWATLDRNLGRAAIKSFVVPRDTPGMEVVRLDKKMGIRASDTASITLTDCRIPKENLLGTADIDTKRGFSGVMQTFDNTRPVVAAMGVGVARAALEHTRELLAGEGIEVRYSGSLFTKSAAEAELIRMEAEWEAGRLLMLKAAWMADNAIPNSTEASMSKAKAARVANKITLQCVELCGGLGYSEEDLLEKWARDSKIIDIFEGTQQIQLLIIARRLLGKRSSELR
ncbi:MAG: acyl-CoA dehydrogenase family protein [Deltaproteobacteria bacterium]|nr:acyl-CoA dehydrogenase family protein [Deltaproteobacteria bacterium]MBW1905006.1 acyl-CoA dehydrogenase family protein [Deltaproteobacteria bacterium]MBW2160742.1 acyl-CoA dehydrogenase family protein [Deltaproteobacteria bacterium]